MKKSKILPILFMFVFVVVVCIFFTDTAYANPKTGNRGAKNCRCYATVKMDVTKTAGGSKTIATVSAGKRMTIVETVEKNGTYYWKVTFSKNGKKYTGYVKRSKCLINVGDYEPDIIVNITNVSNSKYKAQTYTSSSGYSNKKISGLTGKELYGDDNPKDATSDWQTDEAPVTWAMAKKLADASEEAMEDGYQLKI